MKQEDKKLCIYHGNCADGFGAAWVIRKALGEENVEFHPGVYQDSPPDVTGRDVIMADFSYKRSVLLEMAMDAKSIIIIDHHKSAAEDLQDIEQETVYGHGCLIIAHFDMERSGAMMTWDYYYPGEPAPKLIEHIQDRDLWRFDIPGTREIQAALFSYPYDFKVWDELMENNDLAALKLEGEAIERKHHKDILEFIEVAMQRFIIWGYDVPVLNAPYFWSSDAGHIMAQDEPFAACYWDTPDGRVFSLRSTKSGMDVSEIAKQYGGGGHQQAAGFRVAFDHPLVTGFGRTQEA